MLCNTYNTYMASHTAHCYNMQCSTAASNLLMYRYCVYNGTFHTAQLLRIEEELGDKATYAGKNFRKTPWMG
jgi:Enolase, C-terminal TIM barrel domain